MAELNSTENLTIGWFSPGVLTRPSSAIASIDQRDRLRFVDRTARSLIVASLVTACSVGQIGEPRIEERSEDVSTTRGWRRIHVVPGGESPTDEALLAVRRTIGSVGLNEITYRDAREDLSEGDPYVRVLLDAAAEAGFRYPQRLLAFSPVIGENSSYVYAPQHREIPMDELAEAIALY